MTNAPTTLEEDARANNIVVSDIIIAAASKIDAVRMMLWRGCLKKSRPILLKREVESGEKSRADFLASIERSELSL